MVKWVWKTSTANTLDCTITTTLSATNVTIALTCVTGHIGKRIGKIRLMENIKLIPTEIVLKRVPYRHFLKLLFFTQAPEMKSISLQ